MRILIAASSVLAIVVASGASFEAVMRHRAVRDYPPPGLLVDIGGRRLQIDCRGTGSPTVVLESGLDNLGSLSWAAVHDSLARSTRVCAYSRAGILWSDPAPTPFDASQVARDLHAALTTSGETAPWVVVGHSLGGPYVLLFTSLYDAEVAGIVLVDGSHPDQLARFREATGKSMQPATGIMAIGSALAWTGIVRLGSGGTAPPRWPAVADVVPRAYLPSSVEALRREADALGATLREASTVRQLGARPLVVLSATEKTLPEVLAAQGITPSQGDRMQSAWEALQADEATWSAGGRHQRVPMASHYIQFDRPDVVISAVRDVVGRVRAVHRTLLR
ncbi:alpha/beta hydrolase [Gemmatimonas sp.]|uniref:alpha/beta fold hydrolase n=1 Tax=Gemmatimonas sp. TaxID=1962908 RepID=UPI00286E710C|nr:alpha/beta hydrolase [Gemmatimonas sp.]